MSTRLYPLYQRGNPQLRVLLPNFWMKLIPPRHDMPANSVQFIVSPEMTRRDIRQYLEKIYHVPVVQINISNRLGEFRRSNKGYIVKDDDVKYAFVTLPKDVTFTFPELMSAEKRQEQDDQMKQMEDARETHRQEQRRHSDRPGVPTWFH